MIVRADDVTPQPWRNGRGRTRELLAWPDPAAWRLRISVADIEADAPFSSFPGVARWLAVLKGAGIELSVAGQAARRLVRADDPFSFDGAAAAHCRLLDGPTRDLNLMLRGVPGRMHVVADGVEWQPTLAQCGLFSAVAGHCQGVELPPYALLWFEQAPPRLAFVAAQRPAAATGWWLEAGAPA